MRRISPYFVSFCFILQQDVLSLTWWTWTSLPFTSMGLHKSSIRITRGRLCSEEVASMARESACVFPLLGMCSRLKDSNPDYKCLTWLKYPCILSSLASSSPFTWPTTSLEFENIFTDFPPILWTMDIPSNKVSYSASLFMAENYNLNDFSMVSFLGEIRTSPTPESLWFAHHQRIPSRIKVLARRLCKPIFHPCFVLLLLLLMGFSELNHQVCKDLALDRGTRHILDVKSP